MGPPKPHLGCTGLYFLNQKSNFPSTTPRPYFEKYDFSCLNNAPEVGKVTLKSNGDEALSDEFLLKSNGDEALNDVFS
jgi:hypothetical protein